MGLLSTVVMGSYGTVAQAGSQEEGYVSVVLAHQRSAPSIAAAEFVATAYVNSDELEVGPIDDWLITPALIFSSGNVLSFYTRTTEQMPFADSNQLHFSEVVAVNVSSDDTSLGTFTQQLYPVNPKLTLTDHSGLDSLATTPVSRPSAYALGIAGFLFVGGISRRRRALQLQN